MGTPKAGYFQKSGKKVTGYSAVGSRFKESGGLIHWANQEGLAGRNIKETKEKACDSGTLGHDLIEADIYGAVVDLHGIAEDVIGAAKHAFQGFLAWKEITKLEIVETEKPLVSEVYPFGGTLDAIGKIGNKLVLLDWKTSGGIYVEYLLQGAAYQILWNEHYPDRPIHEFHLLRISKPTDAAGVVAFSHHFWSDLSLARTQFLRLLEAYYDDKTLKSLV